MITVRAYSQNPCATLSVPLWKWKNITIPDNLVILHDSNYSHTDWKDHYDEPYFRLYHGLQEIAPVTLERYFVRTADKTDIPFVAEIINTCYSDIQMTAEKLDAITRTPVFDPSLWILAVDKMSKETVGCAIADFDREVGEGILEWVQVLPQYRKQGLGKLLVTELLNRMQSKASFATVSGKVNNETKPEKLYRSCGFEGNDVWHILIKE